MTEKLNFDAYLHAYVDGQLSRQQQQQLQDHLSTNPDKIRELRHYHQINQGLHNLFDQHMQRPVPERIMHLLAEEPDDDTPAPPPPEPAIPTLLDKVWMPSRMAAGILLLVGALTGWLLGHFSTQSGTMQQLQQLAMDAHRVYSQESRHAVEVDAKDKAHLMKWLSKRLGSEVGPADLSRHGYAFLGGRLLPAIGRHAGAYFYKNTQNKRLTLYISFKPDNTGVTSPACERTRDISAVCRWNNDKQSFFLIGALPIKRLLQLAVDVEQQASTQTKQ